MATTSTKAIRVHVHGGPDALKLEAVTLAAPGPGEALIRQNAIGLNFIDVYHRTGLYPQASMPFTPGITQSRMARAGGVSLSRAFNAACPSSTASTSWPSLASKASNRRRISASSSATTSSKLSGSPSVRLNRCWRGRLRRQTPRGRQDD